MSDDRGSIMPLVIGVFLIAMLMVAGSVAAGDAFVQQRALQSECDGAAIAAASSVNVASGRGGGGQAPTTFLELTDDVTAAARDYLARDTSWSYLATVVTLSEDRTAVAVSCTGTRPVVFGALFGFAGGITHTVTSSAKARLRTD